MMLKDPSPLQKNHALFLHSAMGYVTFVAFIYLQKELVMGLDKQQLHDLSCDLTESSHLSLHQGAYMLIILIHLRTISNVEIPTCSI